MAKGHAAEAAPSSSSGVGSGYGLALAGLAAAGLGYVAWHGGLLGAPSSEASDIHHLVNWSGTHEASCPPLRDAFSIVLRVRKTEE